MRSSNRWSDIRVGAFVLVALATLVAGSLWIAGSGAFRPSGDSYIVLIEDSAGLQPGDRVRVAGVPVGRIRSVELRAGEAWPVKIEVSIRSDIALHTDGSAGIATEGLLGVPFLQIDPGSLQAPLLQPGGAIEGSGSSGVDAAIAEVGDLSEQAQAMFAQATELLRTVSAEIKPVLDGLERMLSERNIENVTALLETMNRTIEETGPRVWALTERLERLATQAENGLTELPELTARIGALVDDLQSAMGPQGERLAALLESATRSLESADQTLSVVSGNRHEIEATLVDLRATTANLKSFTQLLNERPYSLVRMKLPADRAPGERARSPE